MHLYEDLVAIKRSQKLVEAVARQDRVLNVQNQRRGVEARRGDGTFGELIPDSKVVIDPGYAVARKYLHPSQEAPKAISRLLAEAKPLFDEFVILRYRAANEPPYPFEWVDYQEAWLDYAAALARISSLYQRRF